MAVDLGTGDGAYVYKSAKAQPNKFFIGIDSNAENLSEYSLKASRRPQKGGLNNVLYVHAGVEALPEALYGLATELTVLLPWGSLLQAVAVPDIKLLKNIARLCKDGAMLRVVFGYASESEPTVTKELALPSLTPAYLDTVVREAYLVAGFKMEWRFLPQAELKNIPTTWAKKLAYGKKRQFIEIKGVYSS